MLGVALAALAKSRDKLILGLGPELAGFATHFWVAKRNILANSTKQLKTTKEVPFFMSWEIRRDSQLGLNSQESAVSFVPGNP